MAYWHWWAICGVLMILEIVVPGAYLLWLGISAAVVGTVLLFLPDIAWQYQWLLFGVFGIVSIAIWHQYQKKNPVRASDHPALNRRGEQYVGRVFTLEDPIVNGMGKVKVDDTIWLIEGTDCAAGTRVKVIGVENTILKVDPAP